MSKRRWTPTSPKELAKGKYLGVLEFQDRHGEWQNFEIVQTRRRLVFGSATNVGLLESGYLPIDPYLSLDENLQELYADLEVYYNDGPQSVSSIVTNARM